MEKWMITEKNHLCRQGGNTEGGVRKEDGRDVVRWKWMIPYWSFVRNVTLFRKRTTPPWPMTKQPTRSLTPVKLVKKQTAGSLISLLVDFTFKTVIGWCVPGCTNGQGYKPHSSFYPKPPVWDAAKDLRRGWRLTLNYFTKKNALVETKHKSYSCIRNAKGFYKVLTLGYWIQMLESHLSFPFKFTVIFCFGLMFPISFYIGYLVKYKEICGFNVFSFVFT